MVLLLPNMAPGTGSPQSVLHDSASEGAQVKAACDRAEQHMLLGTGTALKTQTERARGRGRG